MPKSQHSRYCRVVLIDIWWRQWPWTKVVCMEGESWNSRNVCLINQEHRTRLSWTCSLTKLSGMSGPCITVQSRLNWQIIVIESWHVDSYVIANWQLCNLLDDCSNWVIVSDGFRGQLPISRLEFNQVQKFFSAWIIVLKNRRMTR